MKILTFYYNLLKLLVRDVLNLAYKEFSRFKANIYVILIEL